jgi:hypothetical protein
VTSATPTPCCSHRRRCRRSPQRRLAYEPPRTRACCHRCEPLRGGGDDATRDQQPHQHAAGTRLLHPHPHPHPHPRVAVLALSAGCTPRHHPAPPAPPASGSHVACQGMSVRGAPPSWRGCWSWPKRSVPPSQVAPPRHPRLHRHAAATARYHRRRSQAPRHPCHHLHHRRRRCHRCRRSRRHTRCRRCSSHDAAAAAPAARCAARPPAATPWWRGSAAVADARPTTRSSTRRGLASASAAAGRLDRCRRCAVEVLHRSVQGGGTHGQQTKSTPRRADLEEADGMWGCSPKHTQHPLRHTHAATQAHIRTHVQRHSPDDCGLLRRPCVTARRPWGSSPTSHRCLRSCG